MNSLGQASIFEVQRRINNNSAILYRETYDYNHAFLPSHVSQYYRNDAGQETVTDHLYTYDTFGEITEVERHTLGNTTLSSYKYTPGGRFLSANRSQPHAPSEDVSYERHPNNVEQIAQIVNHTTQTPEVDYQYDHYGNVISRTAGDTQLTIRYCDLSVPCEVINDTTNQRETYLPGGLVNHYSAGVEASLDHVSFAAGNLTMVYATTGEPRFLKQEIEGFGVITQEGVGGQHFSYEYPLYNFQKSQILAVEKSADLNLTLYRQFDEFGEKITEETALEPPVVQRRYPEQFNHQSGSEVSDLVRYGYRLYDPKGRVWLQPDPLHDPNPERSHGVPRLGNLYTFVGNNPLVNYDPMGLEPIGESSEAPESYCEESEICVAPEIIYVESKAPQMTPDPDPIPLTELGHGAGNVMSGVENRDNRPPAFVKRRVVGSAPGYVFYDRGKPKSVGSNVLTPEKFNKACMKGMDGLKCAQLMLWLLDRFQNVKGTPLNEYSNLWHGPGTKIAYVSFGGGEDSWHRNRGAARGHYQVKGILQISYHPNGTVTEKMLQLDGLDAFATNFLFKIGGAGIEDSLSPSVRNLDTAARVANRPYGMARSAIEGIESVAKGNVASGLKTTLEMALPVLRASPKTKTFVERGIKLTDHVERFGACEGSVSCLKRQAVKTVTGEVTGNITDKIKSRSKTGIEAIDRVTGKAVGEGIGAVTP